MMHIVMCGAERTDYLIENKTKRYALLLQVENLANFHKCKEFLESCDMGTK